MKKLGTVENESYVIFTSVFGLPTLTSQTEYIDEVKKIESNRLDPSLFKIMNHDVVPYPRKGEYCARSYSLLKDKVAVQRTGGIKSMIMESIALICQHPSDAEVAVYLAYSYRYFLDNTDSTLMEKAKRLFDSFEFNNLK